MFDLILDYIFNITHLNFGNKNGKLALLGGI
jgi:hypothetical protein